MNQQDEQKRSQKEFVLLAAQLMAAYRAIESERSDKPAGHSRRHRLFCDPFAAQLASSEAKAIALEDPEDEDAPYIIVRTRFFDDFLASRTSSQVVILASGMDARAFRLNWALGTKLYELDYPEILNYKNNILKDTPTTCERCTIPVDFTESWSEKLLEQGYDKSIPSVWLLEGLLYYLKESEVHDLLKTIVSLMATGSWIGLDLMNELCVESSEEEFYQEYFLSGFDNPEDLLAGYDLRAKVIQPGDDGANFGRYTRKFPPRSSSNMARVFLVEALKI